MLTKIELTCLDWIYSALGSKFLKMPVDWKYGRISLKHLSFLGKLSNRMMCLIVLSISIFRLKQLPMLIEKRNINASIFQIIFVARYLFNFIFRQNIWTFSAELVELINYCLEINSAWGKIFNNTLHLNVYVPSTYHKKNCVVNLLQEKNS